MQCRLAECFKAAREAVIISGFVKLPALEWIAEQLPENADATIVGRFSPRDIVSGATDIDAIQCAIQYGFDVKLLPDLHAKIYLFDWSTMIVGSANLTPSGLNLYDRGNIEACVQIEATQDSLYSIDLMIREAITITPAILEAMRQHIANFQNKAGLTGMGQWPENVMPPKHNALLVHQMLWLDPRQENWNEQSLFHDLDLMELGEAESTLIGKRLEILICMKWTHSQVLATETRCLAFGGLTKLLHAALLDSPKPYRRDVKQLVQCLFGYTELYQPFGLRVALQRHREVIILD